MPRNMNNKKKWPMKKFYDKSEHVSGVVEPKARVKLVWVPKKKVKFEEIVEEDIDDCATAPESTQDYQEWSRMNPYAQPWFPPQPSQEEILAIDMQWLAS